MNDTTADIRTDTIPFRFPAELYKDMGPCTLSKRPVFSILMPAYNESDTVAHTLEELLPLLPDRSEVIVAAADPDGLKGTESATGQAASSTGDPRVTVVAGGGLTEGVRNAVEAASSTYVVVMDADGQHDPQIIPKLLDYLHDGYHVAVGETRKQEWVPRYRRVLTALSVGLTRLRMPRRTRGLQYPQSGFFASHRGILVEALENVNGDCFKVLVALLMARRQPMTAGVPTVIRPRTGGASSLSWKIVWADIRLLLRPCGRQMAS